MPERLAPRTAVAAFVRESNAIEGIVRTPTDKELAATLLLLRASEMTLDALNAFQAVIAPKKPLRDRAGLNVRVGNHIAPPGGPEILGIYGAIILAANRKHDPWKTHVRFEILHPYCDGNGRTGRALWAWMMLDQGHDPFALPFLHRFYYQTLSAQR